MEAMATYFTPGPALLGGCLIGLSALILFHTLGRVAGVSGILSAAFSRGNSSEERSWRLAFVVGLMIGPLAVVGIVDSPVIRPSPAPLFILIAAGLLVGLGTGLANGCTSGHGVCGVSRLSPRSLVATAVFLGFGFLTASVGRHLFAG